MIQELTQDCPFEDVPLKDIKPLDYARKRWFKRSMRGKAVSLATIYRWAKNGIHGVKLQVLRMPQFTGTTEDCCRRFLIEVDAAKQATSQPDYSMTSSEVSQAERSK